MTKAEKQKLKEFDEWLEERIRIHSIIMDLDMFVRHQHYEASEIREQLKKLIK